MGRPKMGIAAGGVALVALCAVLGGRAAHVPGAQAKRARSIRVQLPLAATGQEDPAWSPPPPGPLAAQRVRVPLEEEVGMGERLMPDEERQEERELWRTIRGLVEAREKIGWIECRRRIVEATCKHFGFDREREAVFRRVTDAVAAELEHAQAAREAATLALTDRLDVEVHERLSREIEERYQAQTETASGRLEALLGNDERGRRFITGRLEEWLSAVKRVL